MIERYSIILTIKTNDIDWIIMFLRLKGITYAEGYFRIWMMTESFELIQKKIQTYQNKSHKITMLDLLELECICQFTFNGSS